MSASGGKKVSNLKECKMRHASEVVQLAPFCYKNTYDHEIFTLVQQQNDIQHIIDQHQHYCMTVSNSNSKYGKQ